MTILPCSECCAPPNCNPAMTIPTPVLQFRYATQEVDMRTNLAYSCRRNEPADTWLQFQNQDSTYTLKLGKNGGDPFCYSYLSEDIVTTGSYTGNSVGQYELKEYYRCDESGRYDGDRNLGTYETEAESSFTVTAAALQCTTDADGDGEPDVQPSDIVYSCNSKVERGDQFGIDRATGELKVNPLCSTCPDNTTGPICDLESGLSLSGICISQGGSQETKEFTLFNPIPPAVLSEIEYPSWDEATTDNIGSYYFSQAGKSIHKDYRRVQFRVAISPPPPLCYVKIWFIVKVTRYTAEIFSSDISGGSFICDPQNSLATVSDPIYHYYEKEFRINGNPEYSEIKGSPCINNLELSICDPENRFFSEPIEIFAVGGDDESKTPYDGNAEDALHTEEVSAGEGAVIEVMIRKFSYVEGYEPEDPSEFFPFDKINTEVRSKLDGYFTPELEADTRSFINPINGEVLPLPFK